MTTKLNYSNINSIDNPTTIELLNNEQITEKNIVIDNEIGFVKIDNSIFIRTEDLKTQYSHIIGRKILENVISNVFKNIILKETNTNFLFTQTYKEKDNIKLIFPIFSAYMDSIRFAINDKETQTLQNLFFDKSIDSINEKISMIFKIDYDLGTIYNKTRQMVDCMLNNEKHFYELITTNDEFYTNTYFINIYNDLQEKKSEKDYSLLDIDLNKYHDTTPLLHMFQKNVELTEFYKSKPDTMVYIKELYETAHSGKICRVEMGSSNCPYFNYKIYPEKGEMINVSIVSNEITIKDEACYDYIINKCLTTLPIDN